MKHFAEGLISSVCLNGRIMATEECTIFCSILGSIWDNWGIWLLPLMACYSLWEWNSIIQLGSRYCDIIMVTCYGDEIFLRKENSVVILSCISIITVLLHGHLGISFHWLLNCLLKGFTRLTLTNNKYTRKTMHGWQVFQYHVIIFR